MRNVPKPAIASNDGVPSYISASESEATHAYYFDGNHSARKIQNSYPCSIQGGRDYVSKWGHFGGVYAHAKGNDPYFGWNVVHGYPLEMEFYILKKNHSGTLSNYPKLWIGAGGQTHSLTNNVIVPSGSSLTIKSGVTVNLNNYTLVSTGGPITVESGVTINGIILKTGSTINGIYPTIQAAVNSAGSGQTIELQYGNYNESISITNKSNVTIAGKGANSTTISGSVSFNSSQGCSLLNLKVIGNVAINYGTSNNYLSNLTVQGNIQPNMGSYSNINNVDLTSSGTIGIMAGYCNSYIQNSFIRNKSIEGIFATGMNMTISYCTLCCNGPYPNRLDVYSQFSSPDIYLQNDIFSGSTAGSTVSGSYIHWNSWNYCGMPKAANIADNSPQNIKEFPSVIEKLSEIQKTAGNDDFEQALEKERETFDKIRSQNNDKIIDYKQYEKEINSNILLFEDIIKKYPGSVSSLKSLQEMVNCCRLIQKQKDAKRIINTLLNDKAFAELIPQINILVIPLLVDEQNYDEALNLFDEIIKEMPNTSEASLLLYNKANFIDAFKNDKAGAEIIYKQLIEQYPNSIWSIAASDNLRKDVKVQKSEEVRIEKEFSLNNYPNPFNPVTTIKYKIPEDGLVTLKIFDILGREIKTLVSEYKSGGEYSVDFNASGLVSGVYISQLRMNDFVQSKKMILLK
jgi:tetratricopeptide (TPR) repeat protein